MRFAYINPLLPLSVGRTFIPPGGGWLTSWLALTVKRNTFIKFYDYWLPPWECVAAYLSCSLLSVPCLRPSSIRNRIRVQFRFRNWNFMHSQEAVRQWGEWLEILTRNWSIWWRGKTTLESLTICVGNSIYVSEILINLPARRVSLGVSLSPPLPSLICLSLCLSVCISITSRLMCHKLKAI